MKQDHIKKSTQRLSKLLKEKGYEVKHTHLLDIVSYFTYNQSWFSVKKNQGSEVPNTGVSLTSLLKDRGYESTELVVDLNKYLEDLDAGLFKDKFLFGMNKETGNWNLKDFTKEPNALFSGGMGSGKTESAKMTLGTYLFSNSKNSIVFIADYLKGATEYKDFFDIPQVFPILSEVKIKNTIDMLYEELEKRKEAFKKIDSTISIKDWEKRRGKPISRCVLLMEEFHSIPQHLLNFEADFRKKGTTANKLHNILRVGRSYGIWVIGVTQKAASSDIPVEILPNLTRKNVFNSSKAEALYVLGNKRAFELGPGAKGICATDEGLSQFLMIDKETNRKLIKKYVKPLESEMLSVKFSDIENNLNKEEEISFYDQMKNSDPNRLSKKKKVSLLMKKLGHKVQEFSEDEEIVSYGCTHKVKWKGEKTPKDVLIMVKDGVSSKNILRLSQVMEKERCSNGIIYVDENNITKALYNEAGENSIEIVDREDFLALAKKIDLGI